MNKINLIYDTDLSRITNLNWLPWVGENYENTKVIILGESQYEDGDDWQAGNSNATRILIDKCINGSKGPLHKNVEKVILSTDAPTLDEGNKVWKSVAYCNIVQRLMTSIEDRPTDADFDNGWAVFLEIVEMLKPETVIVLGKASSGRLGYYLNNNMTGWERNVDEFYNKEKTVINLTKNGQKLKLIFINHPSGSFGFQYDHWAKLINQEAPSLKSKVVTS